MEKGSLPVSNTSKSTCALPKEKGSTCVRSSACELRLIGASERVGGCELLDASESSSSKLMTSGTPRFYNQVPVKIKDLTEDPLKNKKEIAGQPFYPAMQIRA